MLRSLSFGQKIGAGFLAVASVALIVSVLSLTTVRAISADNDRVLSVYAGNLIKAAKLQTEAELRTSLSRGYLLTKDGEAIVDLTQSRGEFESLLDALKKSGISSEEADLLSTIDRVSQEQIAIQDKTNAARQTSTDLQAIVEQFKVEVLPKNQALRKAIDDFVTLEQNKMETARTEAEQFGRLMNTLLIGIALAGIVAASLLAFLLSRLLSRQIGSAVQHIQSSSTELQAAANQQSTVSREQAASMSEIATTIRELVATARQIAESAQRVAGIAEDTSRGARSGDQTLQTAQSGVANIRGQVDLVVTHMLDLGRKSQQIGGILEVITELADQTNILSINASIEAAGAGDSGRRFGVVADEIRKLADRVGSSAKDIKTLIEEIRGAVHTSVMATEAGSKAVDQGMRQFAEVSEAFQRIAQLVETTTEAAREIELSTKQQTTAVEQVNEAIANIAQASKESEVSSKQTLQTVTELTGLAGEMSRLIQPRAKA